MNILKNKKGGTILIMTLLMLSSILVVALSVSDIVNIGLRINQNQVYSTKAYFAAEAGAEQILNNVRNNSNFDIFNDCNDLDYVVFDNIGICVDTEPCCQNSIYQNPIGDANYTVQYDIDDANLAVVKLTSRGSYSDVQRAIQVAYCSPYCDRKGYECGDNGCGGDCGVCGDHGSCNDTGDQQCNCDSNYVSCAGTCDCDITVNQCLEGLCVPL